MYHDVLKTVECWLRKHAASSDNFEAGFRYAVKELVCMAVIVLRALQHRLSDELSPAMFAKYCYEQAGHVLEWKEFEAEMTDVFVDAFDPRPPVAVGDDVREALKIIILEDLRSALKPVMRNTMQRYAISEYERQNGRRGGGREAMGEACRVVLDELVRGGEM